MPMYYVNKVPQANGDHELHQLGCAFMPSQQSALCLGTFSSCHEAVRRHVSGSAIQAEVMG